MTIKRFFHKVKMGPKWAYNRIHYFFVWYFMKLAKNSVLNPINHKFRPWFWKMAGVD